jgi:3-hydroxyisobutyrate dehydrogenase-like beta-hydroxyacid dehydrogenase
MKTIGFIGLGTMGKPMAANLLKKGYPVVVYNRTKGKTEELEEHGAEVVHSPGEAARSAAVLITMISNDAALEEVYYGSQGIFEGVHPRLTVIDCSTVSPNLSKRIYKDLGTHAVDFLDAPVTGSKPAAIDGSLTFMIGGLKEVIDENMDVFEALGTKVVHMGESGSGSQTKLAHNTIAGINLAALSEGFSIAAKSGIDLNKFLEIVQSGAANSKQADLKGNKIINHDFSNQFSVKLMLKDLLLSNQLTREWAGSTPLLEAAIERYQTALDKGWGEQDMSAVIQCYEEEMGVNMSEKTNNSTNDKPEKSGFERRTSTRVPLQIKLHLSVHQWKQEGSFEGQNIEGILYDLSNNGLQIMSEAPLAQDMFIVIHFPQDAKLPPITGKIIRIENRDNNNQMFRYGCLISGIAPITRKQLEEYIEKHMDGN